MIRTVCAIVVCHAMGTLCAQDSKPTKEEQKLAVIQAQEKMERAVEALLELSRKASTDDETLLVGLVATIRITSEVNGAVSQYSLLVTEEHSAAMALLEPKQDLNAMAAEVNAFSLEVKWTGDIQYLLHEAVLRTEPVLEQTHLDPQDKRFISTTELYNSFRAYLKSKAPPTR